MWGDLFEGVEPGANRQFDGSAIGAILDDKVALAFAGADPPVVAFVIQDGEFFATVFGVILVDARSRVGAIATDILTPSGESVMGAGHEVDERAAGPGIWRSLEDLEIMLIHVSANALIAILIGSYGDVLLRRGIRLGDGAELGVDDAGGGASGSRGHEFVADRAIIGAGRVLVEPEFREGEAIFARLGIEIEFGRFGREVIGFFLNTFFFGAFKSLGGVHEDVAVLLLAEHDEPVTANRFRLRGHEHRGFACAYKIPAILEGFVLVQIVEFEDFVQGLQGKWLFVGFFALPLLRDIVVEIAGVDFFGGDLVRVLNEGHRDDVVGGFHICVDHREDGVLLGLRPVDVAAEVLIGIGERLLDFLRGVAIFVEALQIVDEVLFGGFAAAGVSDTGELFAIDFFHGLFVEFLGFHGFGLLDDLVDGIVLVDDVGNLWRDGSSAATTST